MKNRLPLSNVLFVLVLSLLCSQNIQSQICGDGVTDADVTTMCGTSTIIVSTADVGCTYMVDPATLTSLPSSLDPSILFSYNPNTTLAANVFIDMPSTTQIIGVGGSVSVTVVGQFFDPGAPAICLGDGYCTYTIELVDNENPTITCPAAATADTGGACTGPIPSLTATASDDCSTSVVITNDSPYAFNNGADAAGNYPAGNTLVTFTATDASNNTATCSATVTVNDITSPVITSCPSDFLPPGGIVENAAPEMCNTDVIVPVPVASDNCPVTLTYSTTGATDIANTEVTAGTLNITDNFNVGITTVVYTVSDAAGNTATCEVQVEVLDNQMPTITCPASVTVSNDTDACGATITIAALTTADNCAIATITNDFNNTMDASGFYPLGITTVNYTITDESGNTNACSFTVQVNESELPTITCPDNMAVSTDAGDCMATVTIAAPVAADNCPGEIVTYTTVGATTATGSDDASGTYNIGTTTITYIVTDAAGNSATCSFDLVVSDTEMPTLSCPSDMSVPASPAGSCTAMVMNIEPTGMADNCMNTTVTYTLTGATEGSGDDDASGTAFNGGETTVTYTATDGATNVNTCSFIITVTDTQPPVVLCPGDFTLSTDTGICEATVVGGEPSMLQDNCPGLEVEYTLSGATIGTGMGNVNGLSFGEGVTTVEYVVTDVSGGTATCMFNLTVEDNQAPTIDCVGDVSQNTDANLCSAIVNDIAPTAGMDNCTGTNTITYSITGALTAMGMGDASGTTFPLGESTVTYTIADDATPIANTDTCSFTVTISDMEAPSITCPTNIIVGTDGTITSDPDGIITSLAAGTCEATITFTEPVGTDACPSAATTQTDLAGLTSGDAFPIGTTTLEYTVTDAAGNTAACSFSITVVDAVNPSLMDCPTDAILGNDMNICGAEHTWTHPTFMDDCPGSSLEMSTNGVDFTTITADAGASTSMSFPIGTTTVSYRTTDAGGNTATCSFMVIVSDTEAPVVTCPDNVTSVNDFTFCGANVENINVTATDNCGIETVTYAITGATMLSSGGTGINDASGVFFAVGTSTVTYTVTDTVGITATCSFTVTVNDDESPAISCPVPMFVNTDAGLCTKSFNAGDLVLFSSMDNCAVTSTMFEILNPDGTIVTGMDDPSGHIFQLGISTITYTVGDAEGNESICSVDITVSDNEDPMASCPSDIELGTSENVMDSGGLGVALLINDTGAASECQIELGGIDANALDNCGIKSIMYNLTGATTAAGMNDASGQVFNLGVTTVTYTIIDNADNEITCSFDVTLTDDERPSMEQFPIDRIVDNDLDDCGAIVDGIDPFLIDNCPNPILVTTITSVLPDGTVVGPTIYTDDAVGFDFPVGTSYIVYQLEDMAGNETTFVLDENGNLVTPSIPPTETGFTTAEYWFAVTVNDTQAPTVVTDTEGLTLECDGADHFTQFEAWYNNQAGFTATDNCSVTYEVYDPNTMTWLPVAALDAATYYANYFTLTCGGAGSVAVQWRAIDIGVMTVAATPATFMIEDTVSPVFDFCPADATITTSSDGIGDCAADYTFSYPIVTDACTLTAGDCGTMASVSLTSVNPGDESTIVDPATLVFNVMGTPVTATTQVNLEIAFENVDAELPTEFFFITSEDGTDLGTTTQATNQCNGTAQTVFTMTIAPLQFNQWALDGSIEFTFTPSEPGAGNEEDGINDICPSGVGGGSLITGTLDYDCENLTPGFNLTYAVNGAAEVQMLPQTAATMPPNVTENFGLGMNTVIYTATDCSGNTSSCSFTVVVEDDEAPTFVDCVNPVLVDAPAEDCDPNDYELVRPTDIVDNCAIDQYEERLIQDILFTEHPNIDGYAANDATFSFLMATPPPPLGTATLTITITGDLNEAGEYFSIMDELGNNLGNTDGTGGATLLSFTAGCPDIAEIEVNIPSADLLAMAADGTINIQAIAHGNIPVSASNDGDWTNEDNGVNPIACPTLMGGFTDVNTPGQSPTADGVSSINMNLVYSATTVSYEVNGTTTIAPTDFPTDGSNPIVTLDPGSNTITYYVSDAAGNVGSCEQTITVGNTSIGAPNIVINPNPGAPSCPDDFVVLNETTYSYDPTDPPTWTWYLDNVPYGSDDAGEDMLVSTSNVPSLTFQALEGSNRYYVVITDNFCFSSESNSLEINGGSAPPVPQIFASPNPVCSGDAFGLFIANPNQLWTSYEWEGSNGYQFDGQFPPVITSADNTSTTNNILTYILTISNAAGCTASATANVEVRPVPEIPTVQSNSPVCDGDALVLSSSSNCASYIWIGPDGGSASTLSNPLLQTQTSTTTIPAGNEAYDGGLWSVICVDANSCQSESSATTVVISQPIAAAPSNDGPGCEGEDIQLTVGTVSNATSYTWTGPNGFMSSNQNPVISSPTTVDAGTYTVLIMDANGCTGSGSTMVSISNIPVITAISVNPDANSCVTGNMDISLNPSIDDGDGLAGDTGAPYTYQWTSDNGFTSTNEMAVLPNGTSADNGSYVLVVTNAAGCASEPFTIVVDVRDTPNTPTLMLNETTFCEGDDIVLTTDGYSGTDVVYQWFNGTTSAGMTAVPSLTISNATASNSGNYEVVVTVDGCTSNASQVIPVEVNPIPTTPSVTGPLSVCEGELLQLGTTFIAGAEYVWTGPNAFSASVFNPSIFPVTTAAAGGYSVQIIIDGCSSEFSEALNVAVSAAPSAPTLENNGPICIDEATAVLTLSVTSGTATPGASYEWFDTQTNNSLGMSGLSTNFNMTDFSNYGDGVFEFYAIATLGGCPSSPSVPTTVVLNSIPNQAASAGMDIVACDGLAASLNADLPTVGMGTWTQVAGPTATIANPNAPNTSVTDLVAGSAYTFRWTLSNGACGDYSSDDVDITVNSANQTAEAGTAVATCNSTSTNLNAVPANSGNIGTWTQTPTQSQLGIVIVDINNPTTEVSGLVPGNVYEFTWTLSNNACGDFSTDFVQVPVEANMLNAYAGEDFTACGDGGASILAEPVASCTGTWSSPDLELVFANELAAGTVVMDLKPGENILIWTVDCGSCGISTDEIVVTYETTAITAADIVTVAFNGSTEINVLTNDILPANYTVNVISEPSLGTLSTLGDGNFGYTHTSTDAAQDLFTYQVCSTNCPDVCSEVTNVNVLIEVDENCAIPTIITPNNDGVNDTFIVECLFASGKYPNNVVTIYNQWGDEVFRAMPYANNWAGTYNGEDLPVGTYYYYVELGDGSEPLTGFLLIER